jgi:hypothetical protein
MKAIVSRYEIVSYPTTEGDPVCSEKSMLGSRKMSRSGANMKGMCRHE